MTDTVSPPTLREPHDPGTLLGRDEELALIRTLVAEPSTRLVTVTGPVGVGKSRLVAEVASGARQDGSLQVAVVSVDGVGEAGLAADAVIASLRGNREYVASAAEALWRHAQGDPLLLALDDADAVDGLAELVLELLEAYPALTLLVTRVRPLKVPGERVVALKPLPAPDAAGDGVAVELFCARAAASDAGFELDPRERAAVAAICRMLGGLPLAIEVAAARVPAVRPSTMARQLERSTALLHQQQGSGVADRHRSVDAALDWSIGLLSPDAATLLTQLSVFEGDFPLTAAQHVAQPRLPEPELLDLVSELVDSHLAAWRVDAQDRELLRLEPLVRRHARSRLTSSGWEPEIRDAHAAYWSTQCALDPGAAARSWPDVRAALDRRISTGQHDAALQLAVIAARDLAPGAQATLVPIVESVLHDGSVSDEALVSRTLMWATVHSPADQKNTAAYGAWTARRLRESIALARSSGDDAALLEALELVVNTLGVTFDLEGAVASAHEGYALAGRLHDEAALARFEVWVAMTHSLSGDTASQGRMARSAYERGSRVDDSTAVIHANLMLRSLPPDEAGPMPLLDLQDLLTRAESLHQPIMVLHVLAAIAIDALARRDEATALRALGRMLLISEAVEETWPLAGLAPIMLLVPLTMARGSIEDTVRVRESISSLEPMLPQILPSLAPAYLSAVATLRELVPADRYDALADEVRGLTLGRANRRAQALVRSYLPAAGASSAAPPRPEGPAGERLTPRELEVLERLVAGGRNRDVAEALGMTTKTVMHHTVSIYRKLGVRGRAEAVAWALRSGAVVPPSLPPQRERG